MDLPRPEVTRAAVVVLDTDTLEPCDQATAERPTSFPNAPVLLSFRESLAALEEFRGARAPPDLGLCDLHGLAHPRRFGLACHLGVVLDLPAIGAAKSRLLGSHGPLEPDRGHHAPMLHGDEQVGEVQRTRRGMSPLYVSVGHRCSLDSVLAWVLRCTPLYRLPKTTRAVHRLASEALTTG